MDDAMGISGLFEDDAPQLGGGRRSQVPMNLATQIFDMTRDMSAPTARASASSVPPRSRSSASSAMPMPMEVEPTKITIRDVPMEGATQVAAELSQLAAAQAQQRESNAAKLRELFEKGQAGPLGMTTIPQRIVESAPSHISIPDQFGKAAIAVRDAHNPGLYSGA